MNMARAASMIALCILPVFSSAWCDYSSSNTNSDRSSIKKKTALATTQKAYSLPKNAYKSDSVSVEYDQRPAFEVRRDEDGDRIFSENEAPLVDLDGDGIKGEQEEDGFESTRLASKVTYMNNMGMGKTFSSFQAAGQVQKPALDLLEEKKDEEEEPSQDESIPQEEIPEKKDIPKKVLVS